MQALSHFGWRGQLHENERVEFDPANVQDER
jgi:tRNA pseudouridine65 synthase